MSTFYEIAYRVGFTPWEKAGRSGADHLRALFEREEAERGGPGTALDLGCGTGMHLAQLAERGWAATGVDQVEAALDRARRRLAASGVSATVVHADVTALTAEAVGSGFDLFLDIGCFHGLEEQQRTSMARAVTALSRPGSTLLMLAFAKPVGPPFMPTGATREQVEAAYADWSVVDVDRPPTDLPGMPRMARRAQPTIYRLRRRPQ